MSNFIYGNIICNDISQATNSKIDSCMVKFCLDNDFAIHFIESIPTKDTRRDISFQLSDNFLIRYCECFMEPIVYTMDNEALLDSISKDLKKISGLVNLIFSFEFVDKVEFRFSSPEVDESDYKICKTNLNEFGQLLLHEYLSSPCFPTIKVKLRKN